jgi:hypothetical protein
MAKNKNLELDLVVVFNTTNVDAESSANKTTFKRSGGW